MAITVTTLHTALDAVQTAIGTSDWVTAKKEIAKAKVIRAGLATGSIENTSFSIPSVKDLDALNDAVDEARIEVNRAADNGRRLLRSRVRHGR